MTEILAYPLDTASFDKVYYDATDAQAYTCTRTTGVYSADDNLRVIAFENRTIVVKEGLAWLNFAKFRGIAVVNSVEKNGIISFSVVPSTTFPRIDRVVVSYNFNTDKVEVLLRQGNAASNPAPPSLRRDGSYYEIGLADIAISVGSGNISQANITDLRLDENLCGIMRDGVTEIPTQGLNDQFFRWFEDIKKELGDFDPTLVLEELSLIESKVNNNTSAITNVDNRINTSNINIQNNAANIDLIESKVNSNTSAITNVDNRINTSNTNIQSNAANIDLLKASAVNMGAWTRLPLEQGFYDEAGGKFGVRYWVDATSTVHIVVEVWRDAPASYVVSRLPYGVVPPFHHFFVLNNGTDATKLVFEIDPYAREIRFVNTIVGPGWQNYEWAKGYTNYKTYRH